MPAILLSMKDRFAARRRRGHGGRLAGGRAVGRALRGAGGEEGAAAVEYGLLVALIAVAIIGAVLLLGGKLNTTYTCVGNTMPTGSTSSPTAGC